MVDYSDPETAFKPRRPVNPAARAQKLADRKKWAASLTGVEAEQKAKEAALRLLDRCDQSVAQCRMKLLEKGYPPQAVEVAIERLIEIGLLDDLRFGKMLARTRHQERGLVGAALKLELQRKKIPAETILQIMDEFTEYSPVSAAEKLVEKKLRSMTHLNKDVKFRRLMGMLARKGYGGSVATEVIGKALEKENVDT
ncbi:recombination regulator RecX [Gleimia sp. 6138-11-ORH1]|uniref:regulatory protein RecX n=1 Tax=Gleimia sp. 6138-11-ORH1 TaxID=2973937 RepID=UPI002169D71B|nr:regulatory protein RecX [Gleimia sp. 6138-11-ORH1]MCS4484235.1 recombination regulator RecX [Gleimia sp. 6138-11-ORH1]